MRSLALVLLVAGCDRVYGLDGRQDPDAAVIDMVIDGDSEADGGLELCVGAGLVRACTVVVEANHLLTGVIDTTNDARCQAHHVIRGVTNPCLIAARDISVASLRATGARPLVLFAENTMTVSALIDVSSDRAGEPGAAARTDCASMNGVSGANVGGGGAGGTHRYVGGPGGTAPLAMGGMPRAVTPLTSVVGGCAGGSGGGVGANAPGGAGGGAIYLIAGSSIAIGPDGGIDASGAGGTGGAIKHGGGGGGSGGLIGLDAPVIAINGNVIAKGGAGGGGGDSAIGSNGAEANPENPNGGVFGGSGGGTGGNGGDGSNGTVGGNPSGTPIYAAGGGGGGAGHVLVYGPHTGPGVFNPLPSM